MNIAEALLGVSCFATIAVAIKAFADIWSRRIEARHTAIPIGALDQRLKRIEAAVDVIAIEVERIAEAQRFAARLAAGSTPALLPASEGSRDGRVDTPH
jgi:hypothetical protein